MKAKVKLLKKKKRVHSMNLKKQKSYTKLIPQSMKLHFFITPFYVYIQMIVTKDINPDDAFILERVSTIFLS